MAMIILIGGVSSAGKTLLAQRLLEKYKYPYFSIDHLKMGLYRADIGCGFTPLDSVEAIGEKLWPILKGIIMTAVENEQNLIIEGAYLLPWRIRELAAGYLEKVILFYLVYSDEYAEKNYERKIIGNIGVIEAKSREEADKKEDYIAENARERETLRKHGARYFEIDGDYGAEMEKVCAWLDGERRERSTQNVKESAEICLK